ncbi:MAG: hypothetical protein JRE47_13190 [Deltaproteobacteria bacterium]|nr:hypothetical protein [Deltaproteobacteria bacterium]
MKNIRIDDAGHFYLDEYDISPFVIDHKVLSDERVEVVLQGNVSVPHKERAATQKKRVYKKKVVRDDG